MVAHRGLARLRPENTRAAVLAALDAGLAYAEIDVQLSADQVPVVHHDADLRRMSGRGGDLRRLPWARLRRLPAAEPGRFGARFRGERLCSLAGLARALKPRRGWTLFVELKEESLRRFGRGPMLAAVAAALRPVARRCVLISFDPAVLQLARRSTRFPLGLVLRSLKQARAAARSLNPEWTFCDRRLLPKRGSLKPLFGTSRAVIYEVPDCQQARSLLERGAFAVETFRADTLAQELSLWR